MQAIQVAQKDKKQFAVFRSSNILANNFLPLSEALSVSGGMVIKFTFGVFFLIFSGLVWSQAGEPSTQFTEDQKTSILISKVESRDVNRTTSGIENEISITKDIVHILFFLSMATIGILSYRQAKKTVFSPIKTEIFKYQLQSFEEVISHFQNKSEMDLLSDMDMKSVLDINCFELFCSYVDTFFDGQIKIDEKYKEEKRILRKGAIISADFAAENLEIIGPGTTSNSKSSNNQKEKIDDPAKKLAQWNNRKYGLIHFTENYKIATDKMKKFQSSPLLPSQLKLLINEYSILMHESLSAVGDAVEEASKQMPINYPTSDVLNNFSHAWLSNIYNKKRPNLEPKANEILEFINKYLGIDELASKNA